MVWPNAVVMNFVAETESSFDKMLFDTMVDEDDEAIEALSSSIAGSGDG